MLKRYIFGCLPIIFLLNSQVHSHDPMNAFDFLFFHPGSLVYGIVNSETIIYSTIRIPLWQLSDDGYLIMNPSFLDRKDYTRGGFGLGYRHYLSDYDRERVYVQLKPGLHSLRYKEDTSSGTMIEVLGYVGISIPMICFFDAGIGYKWDGAKKNHGLAVELNAGFSIFGLILLPFI